MSDYRDQGHVLASIVGLVAATLMHLVVGVFVFSSGLIAPGWAVLLLSLMWVGAAWLVWRWRKRPLLAMLVPIGTAAVWWVTMLLGDALLGWTA